MKNEVNTDVTTYDKMFYSNQFDGVNAAKTILGMLYDTYQPQSVIDFGCGIGAWLTAAESLGSKKLTGLDGHWVDKKKLLSKNIDFIGVDFEKEINIKENYDLCISLEVAEHISESSAKTFINLLCNTSNLILFSAAIKYQGGTNHINEQWQSYWVELFNANGFECFDIIRPTFWLNEEIALCYRQNAFVFVKKDNAFLTKKFNAQIEKSPIMNIVHPEYYENKIKYYNNLLESPNLNIIFSILKTYILNKITNLLNNIKAII
jgi:hypothetical protein